MSNHHYFASSYYDWATALTRREAVEIVAKRAGKPAIKSFLPDGMPVYSCMVLAPPNTRYSIRDRKPGDEVVVDRVQVHRVVNTHGHIQLGIDHGLP